MPYFQKPIDSITASDLLELVNQQVAEQKMLDYKRELPGGSDKDKVHFLTDVSAFANAGGGDIIYGIEEKDGKAHELVGLENDNIDASILWLENVIRPGIEPKIIGLQIRSIDLDNGKTAIIIRIPRSWAAPHWVKFSGKNLFFSRNSKGNYLLDLGELRNLFNLSESRVEKLRNFRLERLARIISGDTPTEIKDSPKTVVHLLPFIAFDPTFAIDFKLPFGEPDMWTPLDDFRGSNVSFSFESLYVTAGNNGYIQLFRNGCIEAVGTDLFFNTESWDPIGTRRKVFGTNKFEEQMHKLLTRTKRLQTHYEIEPPYFIACSLIDVQGYTVSENPSGNYFPPKLFKHSELLLPEVYIDHLTESPFNAMRPVFDAVFNAAGIKESPNFDTNGNWKGRR